MDVRSLFKEAMQKDEHTQEEFLEAFEEALGEDVLQSTFGELYKVLYGNHFNEELAKEAVQEMYNADAQGERVNKATTDEVAKKLGLTFENYNEWDWYFVVNMTATDYAGIVDTNSFYKLAKAWLEDKDAPKGKAFMYWWKVIKCN